MRKIILILCFASCNSKEITKNNNQDDHETYCSLSAPTYISNPAIQFIKGRDYQIDIVEDTLLIFDGNRLVGKLAANWDKPEALSELILIDNE